MVMDNNRKKFIQQGLEAYIKRFNSQNEAANSLDNISAATISQIMNNNWDLVSIKMWLSLESQLKLGKKDWTIAETSVFKKINAHLNDMRMNPRGIRGIIINASMGKSVTVEHHAANNNHTYYLRCHRQMSIRMLFRTMLKIMGKDNTGTVSEMLDNLITHLERDNHPLFIIDEVDKLKDEVMEMFIDLENELNGKCGFVWLGTPYLKKRIEAGVSRGKRGFAEIHSRCRKHFWDINPSNQEFIKDAALICKINGVEEPALIIEITNKCEKDFRVLSDLIVAYKNKTN